MAVDASAGSLLISGDDFAGWETLNDTIMGGSSQSDCSASPEGLRWRGQLVSEGGGSSASVHPNGDRRWISQPQPGSGCGSSAMDAATRLPSPAPI